jgi:amidophosphoribosyltransferase
MARDAGATKVFMASAAPPVRYANVYGIDMPTKGELIACGRTEVEICAEIGADALIYQDLDDLKQAVKALNPAISVFETSCFDGTYVTGDVTQEYLAGIENQRNDAASKPGSEDGDGQMDLNLVSRSES